MFYPSRQSEVTMDGVFQAKVINGQEVAAGLLERIREQVADIQSRTGTVPGLAAVLVGDDPASAIYVASKRKQAISVGMKSFERRLPSHATHAELTDLVHGLNQNPQVHGILVQLPLPAHIDPNAVIHAINPDKDVDGFHVSNAGRLATGDPMLVPCTPLGCMMLLKEALGDDLTGLNAVVIGKSNIVGKPMAQLLMSADCTVTVAHIHTRNLADVCCRADILVVAAGSPALVRGHWIKPGAAVIDVGINRILLKGQSRIVGDVAFSEAGHAGAITPVPGGVGPMTVACLLSNTLKAFSRQERLRNVYQPKEEK
jgi:methylenetetrahydrofolate dehydrogenase (NADP+)/methenyltetrahydrofolate cyclohydrolase